MSDPLPAVLRHQVETPHKISSPESTESQKNRVNKCNVVAVTLLIAIGLAGIGLTASGCCLNNTHFLYSGIALAGFSVIALALAVVKYTCSKHTAHHTKEIGDHTPEIPHTVSGVGSSTTSLDSVKGSSVHSSASYMKSPSARDVGKEEREKTHQQRTVHRETSASRQQQFEPLNTGIARSSDVEGEKTEETPKRPTVDPAIQARMQAQARMLDVILRAVDQTNTESSSAMARSQPSEGCERDEREEATKQRTVVDPEVQARMQQQLDAMGERHAAEEAQKEVVIKQLKENQEFIDSIKRGLSTLELDGVRILNEVEMTRLMYLFPHLLEHIADQASFKKKPVESYIRDFFAEVQRNGHLHSLFHFYYNERYTQTNEYIFQTNVLDPIPKSENLKKWMKGYRYDPSPWAYGNMVMTSMSVTYPLRYSPAVRTELKYR